MSRVTVGSSLPEEIYKTSQNDCSSLDSSPCTLKRRRSRSTKSLGEILRPMPPFAGVMRPGAIAGQPFPFLELLDLAGFLYLRAEGEDIRGFFRSLCRVVPSLLAPPPTIKDTDETGAATPLRRGFRALGRKCTIESYRDALDCFAESRKRIWDFVLSHSPKEAGKGFEHEILLQCFLLSFAGEYCCMMASGEGFDWVERLFRHFESVAQHIDCPSHLIEYVRSEERCARILLSLDSNSLSKLREDLACAGKNALLCFDGPEFESPSQQDLYLEQGSLDPAKDFSHKRNQPTISDVKSSHSPQEIHEAEGNGFFRVFLFKPFGYDNYLVLRTEEDILKFFSLAAPGDDYILKVIELTEDEYNNMDSFKGF